MRRTTLVFWSVLFGFLSFGCSSSTDGVSRLAGSGGSAGIAAGGTSGQGLGGASTPLGGTVGSGSGGGAGGLTQGSGGASLQTGGGSGGRGTGGVSANAGSVSSGGLASSGGSTGTGGVVADAGVATGGRLGTGGAPADAGAGTGGRPDTGGSTADAGASMGGRTGGSTGAGGAGSGGTGAGGGPSCGVIPVTPNATSQTRNALCYLYQIYGNHILSSQEENNDDNAMNYIFQNTGKKPAMRAFDVNNSQAPTQCVAHAKQGGLCMFGYHMGIANGDGYASSQTKTDINTVLTDGSAYNTTFKARLDKTAAMIQTAQDGGAVAIMRLFHEAGGTWFWWSMEGGAQYVRLFKYAFNYLTVTKGLKNMIWLLPYDGNPDASFYPGKAFVDIGGADTYAGDGNYAPQTAMYNNCVKVFGSTMPIALHECGPIPDPAQLQSTNTKWVFFSVWTSPYYQAPSNALDHLKTVYTSDYVITLDEMPGF
jgi:beta-mannanase